MAIGRWLKRRRERESALPPGALDELMPAEGRAPAGTGTGPAAAEATSGDGEARARTAELPGADAAEFARMLRRATSTGLPQVSVERHEVDLGGTGLSDELTKILAAFGIERGGPPPSLDAAEAERLNARVREALRRAGIDPDAGLPGPG